MPLWGRIGNICPKCLAIARPKGLCGVALRAYGLKALVASPTTCPSGIYCRTEGAPLLSDKEAGYALAPLGSAIYALRAESYGLPGGYILG